MEMLLVRLVGPDVNTCVEVPKVWKKTTYHCTRGNQRDHRLHSSVRDPGPSPKLE